MTKKEYLQQIKGAEEVVRCNQQELEMLRQLSTSISAIDYSKLRVAESLGGKEGSFTKIIHQMMELEDQIRQDTDRILTLKLQIRKSIEEVEQFEERAVLQRKYLLGETWDRISMGLHISIRQAHRIHENALAHLIF